MCASVLVVRPARPSRDLPVPALTAFGHEVREVDDVDAAVRVFHEDPPDAVVLSLVDANLEPLRQLAGCRGDRFVPIVVLADLDPELAPALVYAGADDFVLRSQDPQVVEIRLSGLLRVQAKFRAAEARRARVERREAELVGEQRVAEKLYARMQHRSVDVPETIRRMVSPHSVFNGDVLLTAQTPAGATRVFLGDFTGHGLVAALGGMPLFDAFHSMTVKGFSIENMMEELNRKLRAVLPTGMFCAAVVFEADPVEHVLQCWNGGMHDVLVRGVDGGIRLRLASRHLALGILPDAEFEGSVELHHVEPGERVLAYSDGVVEAGKTGDLFGQARLETLFGGPSPHDAFVEELDRELAQTWAGSEQADDVTLIDYLFDGRPHEAPSRRSRSTAVPPSHWGVSFELDASALKQSDPVPALLQPVFHLQGLQAHRQTLQLVVAELFNNALDHGLLELDSAWKATPAGFQRYYEARAERLAKLRDGRIAVRFEHRITPQGGRLTIEVEDDGPGFDVANVADAGGSLLKSGRGIRLVRELCVSLDYAQGGRRACAVYDWEEAERPRSEAA